MTRGDKNVRNVTMMLAAAVTALLVAGESGAVPTRISCFTQQAFQSPGVPKVWILTFDEEAKSSQLFSQDLGGILVGTDVQIDKDTINFKFATKEGQNGSAFVFRVTGDLMVSVEGKFAKVLASCQQVKNRF
jgi:hypothetical protein